MNRILKIAAFTAAGVALVWAAFAGVAIWRVASLRDALAERDTRGAVSPQGNAIAMQIDDLWERTGESDRSLRYEVRKFVEERVADPQSHQPASDELRAALDAAAPRLTEMDAILDRGAPEWEEDSMEHMPNLLAHLGAVRTYVARALVARDAGDEGLAWSHLGRAWRLTESATGRPEMISNLIAAAEARLIARAMLELREPAPSWTDDLFTTDFTAGVREARVSESREMLDRALLEAAPSRDANAFAAMSSVAALPWKFWMTREDADTLSAGAWRDGCASSSLHEPAAWESLRSVPARIETVRHEIELARLVSQATRGEQPVPAEICGTRWQISGGASGMTFSLPGSVARAENDSMKPLRSFTVSPSDDAARR